MPARATNAHLARLQTLGLLVVGILVAGFFAACGGPASPLKAPDPRVIEAHSSGFLPRASTIKVVFAEEREGAVLGGQPFSFDPPLRGKAFWADERTLAFEPAEAMESGRLYRVRFDLGAMDGKTGSGDYFDFSFRVREQSVSLRFDLPRIGPDGSYELPGLLSLTDEAPVEAIERVLSAAGPGKPVVDWRHESSLEHRFTVRGVSRGEGEGSLSLAWDGGRVGSRSSGRNSFRVPPAGLFEVLGVRADPEGGSRVDIAFSSPLKRGQDLRGLIDVEGMGDLRYEIDGNIVRLYAAEGQVWPERSVVRASRGILDEGMKVLAQASSSAVAFDDQKPAVRFLTKGTILPTSQGLTVPIETLNLAGVLVEAMQVYGDNMLQFLQVNDYAGTREMARVGEVVWRKVMDLEWKPEWKNKWIRTGLDISELTRRFPDGMYQIRITFLRRQTRYACPVSHDFRNLEFPEEKVYDKDEEGEASYWDFAEQWAGGWDDYYRYKEDPCHPAFYFPGYDHDIAVRRNVVVSDIGMMLKEDASGAWHAAVSDLRSAMPLPGVQVGFYSYQQRLLAQVKTDAQGMAVLKPSQAPAFAVAQLGAQKSYLKVDPGMALAVSHFDLGGEKADGGVKGFLYGERGVWRPGDAMHLAFMLYDVKASLPADYPVVFELEDPRGKVVSTSTYTKSVGGIYTIEAGTPADAPTGTWMGRVRVGDRAFQRPLKVETVMPNRFKIRLAYGDAAYLSPDLGRMALEAAWLHGAPAGPMKADVSMSFSPVATSFGSFSDYTFDDPTRRAEGARQTLFEGRLDKDGRASFSVDLHPEGFAPGKMRANILTRVYETSGAFSSESFSVDFHPYARYAGLKLPKGDASRGMLLTDTEHAVQLALVDREGRPVKSATLDVILYKLEWRWWWESGEDSLAEMAEDSYSRPMQRGEAQIVDGKGVWKFRVAYPEWGRFLVRVSDGPSGHAAAKVVYIDWPGWAGKGRGEEGGAAAMLSLASDKTVYQAGERVAVSFPSNEGGRALVTIERAGTILREEWLPASKDATTYGFVATPDMAPNVYVHVSFIQPHLQTANDLPIRLYGIIPIKVEDPQTRLDPRIEVPTEIAPDTDVSFTVSEGRGRPMSYTVAVVEEGLLGITRYETPNPWNDFYRKEASALKSFDLYQNVAGAYSGKLETMLAVGGGDDAGAGGIRKVSRFPPVVKFFGPFTLKAGEKRTDSFRMGPYIGAVRFMVVASGPAAAGTAGAAVGGAYGKVEKEVPVRAQLMALLTAPRVLSPEEELTLPVTLFSYMGAGRKALLSLKVTGPAEIVGEASRELTFVQDGESSSQFAIRTLASPGAISISVEAKEVGGSRVSRHSIDIESRSLGSPVSTSKAATIPARGEARLSLAYPGMAGTNALELELSTYQPINLAERLPFLIGYPHGCAEQTVSKAFPQLYLPEAANLSAEDLGRVRANVDAALQKLPGFQSSRGAFGFWPGTGEEHDWLTVYVTHFMVEARRASYALPPGLLGPALDYLKAAALLFSSNEPWAKDIQAYRLYVLALAGLPDAAAMNRLRESRPLQAVTSYRLAAAYALSGMRQAAVDMVKGVKAEAKAYEGIGAVYGSELRDAAVILEALNAIGDSANAFIVYKKVAEALSGSGWLSTQETAYALVAALPFLRQGAKGGPYRVSWSLSGGPRAVSEVARAMATIALPLGAATSGELVLKNESDVPIYARAVATGVAKVGDEKPQAAGLSLQTRYLTASGAPVDPDRSPMGEDLVIEAIVVNRTPSALRDIAITHRLPSGWEIKNSRLGGEAEAPSAYDYQDIRDDRVLTYFSLAPGAEMRIRIVANKAYEGAFWLPSVYVEAMYDAAVKALVPGRKLSPSLQPGANAPRQKEKSLSGRGP